MRSLACPPKATGRVLELHSRSDYEKRSHWLASATRRRRRRRQLASVPLGASAGKKEFVDERTFAQRLGGIDSVLGDLDG